MDANGSLEEGGWTHCTPGAPYIKGIIRCRCQVLNKSRIPTSAERANNRCHQLLHRELVKAVELQDRPLIDYYLQSTGATIVHTDL